MRPCLALLVAAAPWAMIAPAVALRTGARNGTGAPGGAPNFTHGGASTNSTRPYGHLEQQLLNKSHHTVEIAGWTYNASYGFCVDNCNRDIGPVDGEVGPLHMTFPLCVEACSEKDYCTGVEWWPQNLCYLFYTRSLLQGCGGKGPTITSIACMVKATATRPSFLPADCSAREAPPPPPPAGAAAWGPGTFVADAGNFRVMLYAPATATTPVPQVVAGGNGRGDGLHQLDYPHMVLVDARGHLLVSDTYNHRVVKWAPHAFTGERAAGGNGKGSGLNQLYNPKGMALDGAGYLFIADSMNHRVVRWVVGAPEGRVMAGGHGEGTTNKHIKPYSVAIDSHNVMIIVDVHMHRVLKWRQNHNTGHILVGFHGRGAAVNQINTAIGVTVDHDNIYVADYFNHRVLKFPPDSDQGVVVAGGHGKGNATHQLSYPSSVTVDANGHYIVADTDNNRVMDWPPLESASGTVVAGGLGEGTSPQHLSFPKFAVTVP